MQIHLGSRLLWAHVCYWGDSFEANLQVSFILVRHRDVLSFRTMGVFQSIPTAHWGLQDGSAIPRTSNLPWSEMLPLPLLLDTIPLMQRAAKALRPKHSLDEQTLHDLLMLEFLAEFDAMATVLMGLLLTVEKKNEAGLFAAQIDKLVCLLNELLHKDLEGRTEIEVSFDPILGDAHTLTEQQIRAPVNSLRLQVLRAIASTNDARRSESIAISKIFAERPLGYQVKDVSIIAIDQIIEDLEHGLGDFRVAISEPSDIAVPSTLVVELSTLAERMFVAIHCPTCDAARSHVAQLRLGSYSQDWKCLDSKHLCVLLSSSAPLQNAFEIAIHSDKHRYV